MVGFNFFLTCSPILDLGHFSQLILPIVLQFMPNHQVLFTASDGWGNFFLTCSPILDLGHFSQVILPIVLIMPNHQVLTASDGWGYFFLTCSPILDLGHFSQVILPIVLQIAPTIRCCSQHLMVGVIFFLTCSPILDLGHFSQVILPIVLQIMPQPSGAGHSIWWLGLFFFWPVLPFWT